MKFIDLKPGDKLYMGKTFVGEVVSVKKRGSMVRVWTRKDRKETERCYAANQEMVMMEVRP